MSLTPSQQPGWVRPTMYVASVLIVAGLVALAIFGALRAGLWPAVAAAVLMITGFALWLFAVVAYRRAGGKRIR